MPRTPDILFINSCARKDSRTKELAQHLIENLNGECEELSLYEIKIPTLDEKSLNERLAYCKERNFSHPNFDLAKQFAAAKTVVIAAPYWDLLFPAVLRSYLEAVAVPGIAFRYTEHGVEGLCEAKTLYYVTTAGGFIGENDFGYRYVSALATKMFGVEKTYCFSVQGLDVVGNDSAELLNKAKDEVTRSLRA